MPTCIADDIQDLIRKILVLNPKERLSIEDIKNHPWYKSNIKIQVDGVPTIEKVSGF